MRRDADVVAYASLELLEGHDATAVRVEDLDGERRGIRGREGVSKRARGGRGGSRRADS